MLISDISVKRPVFAAVISLILVLVGFMSMQSMTLREYPDIQRPVVSISTSYRGAASDIVERRVTQILEDQLAGVPGIRKISSISYDERSSITLEFSRRPPARQQTGCGFVYDNVDQCVQPVALDHGSL